MPITASTSRPSYPAALESCISVASAPSSAHPCPRSSANPTSIVVTQAYRDAMPRPLGSLDHI